MIGEVPLVKMFEPEAATTAEAKDSPYCCVRYPERFPYHCERWKQI